MDAQTCLKKLQYVGVLNFATVGPDGSPQVRCISAVHYEPDALYFFTARGKSFCRELEKDGRVQILAYTKYKEMIRVSSYAVPVAQDRQSRYIDRIFAQQPYLSNVYPGDTRRIGIVFAVRDMEIEYFHLGVHPIFRESYTVGKGVVTPKGYEITADCIGCGTCVKACPQKCIEAKKPFHIVQEHCLHCGACFERCPVKAVTKRGTEQ
ncbi:MAG TPA: 4Fe-4S binding protein [Firmicutes bacterium]|mgnify:FL=1|nr:4Fe-4S binding protein [Bacillota bacterium]